MAREVETTTQRATDGQVLGRCEGLLLTRGREFLATILQQMAQHTADEAVKKGAPYEPTPAANALVTKGVLRA